MNHKVTVQAPWPELAHLIRSLGESSFTVDCLDFVRRQVKVDHLALFSFDTALKPFLIGGTSPPNKNIVMATGQEYIRSFYRSEPNLKYIRSHSPDHLAPLMLRLKASDIKDSEYRAQIYQRKGLVDRVSWIGLAGANWYSANLYRDQESGCYNREDLNRLQQMGELLCAAIEQHIRISTPIYKPMEPRPSIEYLENLLVELGGGLTGREIAVCARALSGMTRAGIGLDLSIKPTTVATLTQRAYAKLNLSSLSELFARCLHALSLSSKGSGHK